MKIKDVADLVRYIEDHRKHFDCVPDVVNVPTKVYNELMHRCIYQHQVKFASRMQFMGANISEDYKPPEYQAPKFKDAKV